MRRLLLTDREEELRRTSFGREPLSRMLQRLRMEGEIMYLYADHDIVERVKGDYVSGVIVVPGHGDWSIHGLLNRLDTRCNVPLLPAYQLDIGRGYDARVHAQYQYKPIETIMENWLIENWGRMREVNALAVQV